MKLKTLSEISEETLKRYKGADYKPIFDSPAWLIIRDGRSRINTEIDFERFIVHLEEDYNKHYEAYQRWLMDEEGDGFRNSLNAEVDSIIDQENKDAG